MYSKSQKSHPGVPVNRDFLCLDSLSGCIMSTTDFIFYGILHKKPIKTFAKPRCLCYHYLPELTLNPTN